MSRSKLLHEIANHVANTPVSGSWSQTYPDVGIDIKDRSVDVIDGAMFYPQHATYHPTSNNFNYSTGFDYVLFYPTFADTGTGPRAFSDCKC